MSVLSITELKRRFSTTDKPSARDYEDMIDTLAAGLQAEGLPPTGDAGGALTGQYPDPDIATDAVNGATHILNTSTPVGKLSPTGGSVGQVPTPVGGAVVWRSVSTLLPSGPDTNTLGSVAFNSNTSANYVVPAAGASITPFAHLLPSVPTGFQVVLECQTGGDLGYAELEVIDVDEVVDSSNIAPGFAVSADATYVYVRRVDSATTLKTTSLTSGLLDGMDASKWNIRITAWCAASHGVAAVQYELTNPLGGLSYGSDLIVGQFLPLGTNNTVLQQINLTSNNVTTLASWAGSPNLNFALWPLDTGKEYLLVSVGNPARLTWFNLADSFDTNSWTLPGGSFANVAGMGDFKPILLLPSGTVGHQTASASASVTYPDIYLVRDDWDTALLDSLVLYRLNWSGSAYAVATTGYPVLNLRTAVPALAPFAPVAGVRVTLFQYNPIKKRLYLSESNTGLLHILELTASCDTLADLWHYALNDPNNMGDYVTLAKSIIKPGSPGIWSGDPANDHSAVEFDLTTGQEMALVASRRGPGNMLGAVVRIPWVE